MFHKKVACIMLLLFCFSGCTEKMEQANQTPLWADMKPEATANAIEPEEYHFSIARTDYTLNLYEPPEGCYLGAYILSNKQVAFDIQEFENLAGPHGIYAYHMFLGDPFPTNWVLSCIANTKTPYITLNGFNLYDEKVLIETAKKFGEFYLPMFLEFYPVDKGYDAENYIAYYRKARNIFRRYASNVAFIWSVPMERAFDSNAYYPGDTYVDWVGVRILETLHGQDAFAYDVLNAIHSFYLNYHHEKPVYITGLAVSHFSNYDFVYRTSSAALEIERIYQNIVENYPRIKGINYLDFNSMDLEGKEEIRDDFSITNEEGVLNAYRQAVAHPNFLTELVVSASGNQDYEIFKSVASAYKTGDFFYLPDYAFSQDLHIRGIGAYSQALYLDGRPFYNIGVLEEKGLGVLEADEKTQTLYFTKNTR